MACKFFKTIAESPTSPGSLFKYLDYNPVEFMEDSDSDVPGEYLGHSAKYCPNVETLYLHSATRLRTGLFKNAEMENCNMYAR